MKQVAQKMPTAALTVGKSRIKIHNKNSGIPTYYLTKGQEFGIELFNPTTTTILAKISLNKQSITQGGLVLRPGERVFLERYIDVAKKFKFDTYEVANTAEVKEAIKENGDFKVEFYAEDTYRPNIVITRTPTWGEHWDSGTFNTPSTGGWANTTNTASYSSNSSNFGGAASVGSLYNSEISPVDLTSNIAPTGMNLGFGDVEEAPVRRNPRKKSLKTLKTKSKSIETGRVEEGSNSEQKLQTISKKFVHYSFHTLEYKLLPISQKVNTSDDIQVAGYCTECGTKTGKTHKFCNQCGNKV
jgi:hypothetical protein